MEQREQNKIVPENGTAAKKPNRLKICLFILLPLVAVLAVAVIWLSLMPTSRLAKVNGIYYATQDGELSEDTFIKFKTGKWLTSDGSEGTYEILGDELLMRANSASEEEHYHATIKNGVLILEGLDTNNVFAQRTHKHKYGEWFTLEEVTNCAEGGLSACLCICGKQMTQPILPQKHNYYTETLTEPTCLECGVNITRCRNCLYSFTEETARVGHLLFSQGGCSVCGEIQLKYELSEDGTHYIVTGFADGMEQSTVVSMLETYEGLPVTEVASQAFYDIERNIRFEIPASITKIGTRAFSSCGAYSTIVVAKENPSYHSYETCCLIETESKTLVCGYLPCSIPSDGSVTKIGDYAFAENSELTELVIPNGVTEIGRSVFSYCNQLRSIDIPDSVTEIGNFVFEYCRSLKSVRLPSGLKKISHGLFYLCNRLESVNIPNGVEEIKDSAFFNCDGLTSLSLPDSVRTIASDAFNYCDGLTSVHLPKSLTDLSPSAFRYCNGIRELSVEGGNPVYHSAGNCIVETATKTLLFGCATSVIPVDGSVTKIGDYAFADCANLTSITIPRAVTEIGKYAFAGCVNMSRIRFLNSILGIGQNAFNRCTGLETIALVKDVTFYLSEDMFADCIKLNKITFGGTSEEWNKVKAKVYGFKRIITVHCTDVPVVCPPVI